MGQEKSYLEQCIDALPAHKQEAARRAWKSFGEGDDSTFSRMLVLLEATNAMAERIPFQLSEVSRKMQADLDGKCHALQAASKQTISEHADACREIISSQLPIMAKSLAIAEHKDELRRQGATLARLERSIERMRHLRINGLLALLAFGCLATAATIIGCLWTDYHQGKDDSRFLDAMNKAGVDCVIERRAADSSTVKIVLSRLPASSRWIKDENGNTVGLRLVIPNSP